MPTPTTHAPLRIPCPVDGKRGPAVMVCSHVRLEGGPPWCVVPGDGGVWGFACPTCTAALNGLSHAAEGDFDAAADLASRIMRPICRHCLELVRGPRWMAVQAAVAEVLTQVDRCGLCGGPPDRVRSLKADVGGEPGLMIVAVCSACETGRADGERIDVDPACSRFVLDHD